MDDAKVAAVKELIARHGDKVLDEPRRFEALLKDTPLSAPEIASMIGALKLGIPQRLLAQAEPQVSPGNFARYVDRLSTEMALRDDAAHGAVTMWARALGRDVPAGAPPPPPPPVSDHVQAPPSPGMFTSPSPGPIPAGGAASVPPNPAPATPPGATPLPPGKKSRWFGRIETREEALQAVKDASIVFFVVAAIQLLLTLLIGPIALFDAAINGIGGIVLRQINSRVAAIVLLLDAGIGVLFGFSQGHLPIVAVIAVLAGIRATDATFKLHRRPDAQTVP